MNGQHAQVASAQAQIPLELLRSTPRDLALTGLGTFALGGSIALVVGAIVFSVGIYISASHKSALKQEMARDGQLTSGVIVQTYRTSGKNRQEVFIYQYTVDGRAYRGRITARVRNQPAYPLTISVPVRYLPSRPDVSWLDGHPPAGVPLLLIPVLATGFFAGAGAIFWTVRRQHELLAEGRPALARVTSIERVRKGEHNRQRAHIEFTLLSGATRQAYLDFTRNAPQPGSTVVIVYDRENPARLMRYPSPLLRVPTPGS